MSAASVAVRRLRVAPSAIAETLTAVRPLPVLAVLVALQLAQAAWFGLETPHNGWIWYSGGDATEYWTETWAIAHGIVPQAMIGYGLPVFYGWVPLVAGPTLMTGAAVIVVFQAVVLVPLALILFWLVADRLFGRVYAWFAAALWVAGPLLLLHGFVDRYHSTFDQLFLAPHWFGLTNMADLPSLVAVLACAWMTLRWFDTGSPTDAVVGGLLGGLTIALKPSNGFFFLALAVLVIGARRPRQAALFAAGVVPALVALALWKVRGLGFLPLTASSYQKVHVAAGTSTPLAFTTSKYLQFDWHHLQLELRDLREVFWSLRFLEFLMVAGAFGVIRKNALKGLFVVVWFAGYGILKGSNMKSDFTSANWFRLAEPGLPAYILLAVGVAFCLPGLGRRVRRAAAVVTPQRIDRRRLAIAGVLLGAVPLAVVGLAQPASSMRLARDNRVVNEAPLTRAFHLRATVTGRSVQLSWNRPGTGSTKPLYQVYVSTDGDGCQRPSRGSIECLLQATPVELTSGTTYDATLGHGPRWYRVGIRAAYRRSLQGGDLMLLSQALRVSG